MSNVACPTLGDKRTACVRCLGPLCSTSITHHLVLHTATTAAAATITNIDVSTSIIIDRAAAAAAAIVMVDSTAIYRLQRRLCCELNKVHPNNAMPLLREIAFSDQFVLVLLALLSFLA